MGIFSLTKEIAIDLGTANTIIIHNDKIVVDEPSIVAIEVSTGKMITVGKEAQMMQGREPEGIRTIRPLRKGVIADFRAAEMMIRGLVEKASQKSRWFSPSMRMVVGIPPDRPKWRSAPCATPRNMPADATSTCSTSLWPQPSESDLTLWLPKAT